MKVVGWIVGVIVLAVIAAIVYVVINSGDLLKSGIESFGPDYLGAPVTVGSIDISPTEGSAQVNNFRIGNPQGFEGATSMAFGEIKATLDTAQTTEQLVVIKRLAIDSAELVAIAKGDKTNLQQLMDNLEQATSAGETGGSTSAAAEEETKFIVEQFDFTNARTSLDSDLLGQLDLQIPDIRLTDIGKRTNGATVAELAEQLLKPITRAVSREAVNQGLDVDGLKANVKQKVEDKVKEKLGSGLRNLLRN